MTSGKNMLTVHSMAKSLGVSDRTIERWYAAGLMPEPSSIGPDGTKFWTPEQMRQVLLWRLERQRKGGSVV